MWTDMSVTQKTATVAAVVMGGVVVKHALSQGAPADTAPTISEGPDDRTTYTEKTSADYSFWAKDCNRPVMKSKQGAAAMKARTVPQVFAEAVKKYASKPILKIEDIDMTAPGKGETAPEGQPLDAWRTWSYSDYYNDCKAAAAGFIALGFEKHDAVSVYGFNSPQWHMGSLAAIMGGGVVAGIYPSDTAEQVEFKVKHSGATVAVVQDEKKLEMLQKMGDALPKLKAVVVWTHAAEADFHQSIVEKKAGGRKIKA